MLLHRSLWRDTGITSDARRVCALGEEFALLDDPAIPMRGERPIADNLAVFITPCFPQGHGIATHGAQTDFIPDLRSRQ